MSGGELRVVIDPEIAFGQPCIMPGRIPVHAIVDRFRAGESVESLCADYGIEGGAVATALLYVATKAAPRSWWARWYQVVFSVGLFVLVIAAKIYRWTLDGWPGAEFGWGVFWSTWVVLMGARMRSAICTAKGKR
jgi:uncharacterized protein (DUF433 family)